MQYQFLSDPKNLNVEQNLFPSNRPRPPTVASIWLGSGMPLVSGLVLFLNYLDGNLTLHGVFVLPEFLAFVVQNMDSVIGCQSPELTLFKAKRIWCGD